MELYTYSVEESIGRLEAYAERQCNKCVIKDLLHVCDSCDINVIKQAPHLIKQQKVEIEKLTVEIKAMRTADVVPRELYEEEKLRRESLEGQISSEERRCGMNHDATHCADYTKDCPKSCFRAQLTEELRKIYYPLPTSWARFKGTKECPKTKKGGAE